MKFPRFSPISGKINVMDLDVTKDQFVAWEKGALIQDAFPNLTPDEREFLKTGVTRDEWDAMFGDGGEMYDP
tara:strand:- start:352 stop:567 length:216 start_codon:yes stop_codon:yes gene_type:complete